MAWDSNLDPQSPAYQIAAESTIFQPALEKNGSGKSAFAPTKRPGHACSMNSLVSLRSQPTLRFRMYLERGCGFTKAC